jgi:CRISPR/Cas system-associated protein Csm6
MKKRVLITGVYSGKAVKIAIAKLSLDKIFLVLEKDYDCKKNKSCIEKENNVKELKEQFSKILEIELLKTESVYNIYNIAEEVVKQIDKIPEDNEILIHVSEGTKIMSFALNLAANARKERISGIYYIIEETNEIIKLPALHFPELNKTQEAILKLIKKKVNKPEQFITELKKSKSVIYQSIKQLQEKEYVHFEEGRLSLSPLGKIKVM